METAGDLASVGGVVTQGELDALDALTRRPGPGSHLATIVVDDVPTETLADLPPLRDRLLFVGLNPSPVSVKAGHYHQG